MGGGSTVQPERGERDDAHARRRGLVAIVVLALSIGAFGVVLGLSALWPEPDPNVLALPEMGDTTPAVVGDDVAVWVVHTSAGAVHVLAAVDPALDRASGPGDAWASDWCPVGRYFESPWGARFDELGAYLGGPAGHGLTERVVESIDFDTGTLQVGEPYDDPAGASTEPEWNRRTCTARELVVHPAYAGMSTLSRPAVVSPEDQGERSVERSGPRFTGGPRPT